MRLKEKTEAILQELSWKTRCTVLTTSEDFLIFLFPKSISMEKTCFWNFYAQWTFSWCLEMQKVISGIICMLINQLEFAGNDNPFRQNSSNFLLQFFLFTILVLLETILAFYCRRYLFSAGRSLLGNDVSLGPARSVIYVR